MQPSQPLEGYPFPLASRGKRIGAAALDALFLFVTCYIGWIVWNLIVWKDGQSPGKQLLKLRVYGTELKRPANWAHMAIRNFLIPFTVNLSYFPYWLGIINGSISVDDSPYSSPSYLFALVITFAFSIAELITFFTSPTRQKISDRIAKTVVLDESVRY